MEKSEEEEEMRVKDWDGNRLVVEKAARHRWAEYYYKLLNMEDSV